MKFNLVPEVLIVKKEKSLATYEIEVSADLGVRLIVFSRKVGLSSYEATVVERSNDNVPSNYFIRKAPMSRFFNEESKRKFQVQATEAILMVDSAEQEYEADIYFWSNGRFRREPVDD